MHFFFSFNHFASLAVVVVLPEPCKPAIMIAGGLHCKLISHDSSLAPRVTKYHGQF